MTSALQIFRRELRSSVEEPDLFGASYLDRNGIAEVVPTEGDIRTINDGHSVVTTDGSKICAYDTTDLSSHASSGCRCASIT